MIKSNNSKHGFTLIELSLSMIFLAILLLVIALITTQIIVIYQKGLAIKAVSSTGKELIDDFSRAIAASPAKSTSALCARYTNDTTQKKCKDDEAFRFVYQQAVGKVKINGSNKKTTVPTHGVFCTGRYSYIWNTGYTVDSKLYPHDGTESSLRARLVYKKKVKSGGNYIEQTFTLSNFRLLKMRDSDRNVCASHINNKYNLNTNSKYNAGLLENDPEELLGTIDYTTNKFITSEDNLALYDFKIFPPTQHFLTFHSFYSGTFTLATVQGGVDITGVGDYCQNAPDALNTDFAYCAINKFNFAMRATGETNDEEKHQ